MTRSRSYRKLHKRGGSSNPNPNVVLTGDNKPEVLARTVAPASEATDQKMSGGRSRRRHNKRKSHHRRKSHRGGNMLATAVLPFGLFGLQKYFQKSRTNPIRRSARRIGRSAKRLGRSARRTVKRIF